MSEILSRIVFCREAIETGDIGLVADILADLEHDLAAGHVAAPMPFRCSSCGESFACGCELAGHELGHEVEAHKPRREVYSL